MFETAVFTDVQGHEALDGRSGFNFQAASAGFDGADQNVARESMIHQVSRRPWAKDGGSGGVSFACRNVGGRYYFSRGRDLGATASGRPGNQITQIVVTSNPEDLDPYTPAQIFSCTAWDVAKRPTRDSETWTAPVELDPAFESDSLVAWARADAARWRFLPRLLAAVEAKVTGRGGARVVLVHEDLETTVRWFALASVLSNPDAVRSLSFYGLADDPTRTDADIVACASLDRADVGGAVVCDLGRLTGGLDVESFGVRRTMELLEQRDTYEALEVVSLARKWDPVIGDWSAFWASELVNGTLPPEARTQPNGMIVDLVDGLGSKGFGDDLVMYGSEFAEAFAVSQPGTSDVTRLARAAGQNASSGSPHLAALLLDASVAEVEQQPGRVREWASTLLSTSPDPWPAEPDRRHWIEALTRVAEGAEAADLPLVFALAGPLQEGIDIARWAPLVQRFCDLVLGRPAAVRETSSLWNGSLLRENIRGRLLRLFEEESASSRTPVSAEAVAVDALRRGEWRELVQLSTQDGGPTADALGAWQRLADFSRQDGKARVKAIRKREVTVRPEDWAVGLADTDPINEPDLWVTWMREVGTTPTMADFVVRSVSDALASPVTRDKDLPKLQGLLAPLVPSDGPVDPAVEAVATRLATRLDERETTGDRLAKLLGRGKVEPVSDSRARPPEPRAHGGRS